VLTRDAYGELGGVSGALAASAEAIYQRLTPSEQRAVRQLMLRLVTPGLGVPDARRRVVRAELVEVVGAEAFEVDASFDADPSALLRSPAVLIDVALAQPQPGATHMQLRPLIISVGYFQFDFPLVLAFSPVSGLPTKVPSAM
jgi:hypothetical protein